MIEINDNNICQEDMDDIYRDQFKTIIDGFVYNGYNYIDIDNLISNLSSMKNDGIRSVEFVDEKIDDGSDDDYNEYIMMRSYDIDYKGHSYYVRFFYGNNDREVGCYEVNEN